MDKSKFFTPVPTEHQNEAIHQPETLPDAPEITTKETELVSLINASEAHQEPAHSTLQRIATFQDAPIKTESVPGIYSQSPEVPPSLNVPSQAFPSAEAALIPSSGTEQIIAQENSSTPEIPPPADEPLASLTAKLSEAQDALNREYENNGGDMQYRIPYASQNVNGIRDEITQLRLSARLSLNTESNNETIKQFLQEEVRDQQIAGSQGRIDYAANKKQALENGLERWSKRLGELEGEMNAEKGRLQSTDQADAKEYEAQRWAVRDATADYNKVSDKLDELRRDAVKQLPELEEAITVAQEELQQLKARDISDFPVPNQLEDDPDFLHSQRVASFSENLDSALTKQASGYDAQKEAEKIFQKRFPEKYAYYMRTLPQDKPEVVIEKPATASLTPEDVSSISHDVPFPGPPSQEYAAVEPKITLRNEDEQTQPPEVTHTQNGPVPEPDIDQSVNSGYSPAEIAGEDNPPNNTREVLSDWYESQSAHRFILPEDKALRQRIDSVKDTFEKFQKSRHETVGLTLFGSMTKGYADEKSDVDGFLFIDADMIPVDLEKEPKVRTITSSDEIFTTSSYRLRKDLEREYTEDFQINVMSAAHLTTEHVQHLRTLPISREIIDTEVRQLTGWAQTMQVYEAEIERNNQDPNGWKLPGPKCPTMVTPSRNLTALFHLQVGQGLDDYRTYLVTELSKAGDSGERAWKEIIEETEMMEQQLRTNTAKKYPRTLVEARKQYTSDERQQS